MIITYYIYALLDNNSNIFYIGSTKSPKTRLVAHISRTKNPKEKAPYYMYAKENGFTPSMKIIHTFNIDSSDRNYKYRVEAIENEYIKEYSKDHNIINKPRGGAVKAIEHIETPIQKANERLIELSEHVTSEDKQKCVAVERIHLNTVNVYLRGNGAKLGTAMKLIDLLKKEIKKREAVLA